MDKVKALFSKLGADDTGLITFDMLEEPKRIYLFFFEVPSHQLTWKCKKALSKRKVVSFYRGLRITMLAGGRVTSF